MVHVPFSSACCWGLYGLCSFVSMVGWCEMLTEVCLCVRLASASGKGVVSVVWLWSMLSLWRRAFVIVVINLPSGAWSRASFVLTGWCVIS